MIERMNPSALSTLIRLAWDALLPQIPDCAIELAVLLNVLSNSEELDEAQIVRLVELLVEAGVI